MANENAPNTDFAREFLEVLRPLLRRIRSERSLSPGKMGILYQLSQQESATGAELAAAVRISPQAISLATGELVDLGWIRSVPDAVDRRKKRFELTEVGKEKLTQEIHAGEGWISQAIAEKLSLQDREVLAMALPVLEKIGREKLHG
ncbi:MarR family transcriptional regulator [Arthrobacter sp. MYb227]|uniref:MarR family winged helix-turn-helix transcriptional regulator n=1 Tax=Arthrobacter sp. MYb227 TaxID=1848601 RepID=UPI000CFDCF6E|nr:MarR family transcriptional regulator [Arthrobacter sp. MYb227]PQZ94787.1 MarR family transcriptional regulator [Arthrobacter sp. MYb227]